SAGESANNPRLGRRFKAGEAPNGSWMRRLSRMQLRPLGDRVVVQPIEREERTQGGIYLPDTAKEKPQEGKVVAVGSGKLLQNGERAPVSVKVGERVLFPTYAGTEVKIDGTEYLIMNENEILAVVEE